MYAMLLSALKEAFIAFAPSLVPLLKDALTEAAREILLAAKAKDFHDGWEFLDTFGDPAIDKLLSLLPPAK